MVLNIVISIFIILFIILWIYAIQQWRKPSDNNGIKNIKWPFIYSNLSSLFTSIGVLGTFSGITVGLLFFNEDNVTNSIPLLLAGLKTAFITSIIGIISSIIAGRISAYYEILEKINTSSKSNNHLTVLNKINSNLDEIKNALVGKSGNSLHMELTLMKRNSDDQLKEHFKQSLILQDIKKSVANKSSNLIQEFNSFRNDNNQALKTQDKNYKELISIIKAYQNEITDKISTNTVQVNKNEKVLQSITKEIQKQSGQIKSGISEISKNQIDAIDINKENAKSIIKSLVQNNSTLIEQLNTNNELISEKIITVNEQLLLNKESLKNLSENIVRLSNDLIENHNNNNTKQIKSNKENFELVLSSMNKNNEMLTAKFKEFTDLLAKSNTEALVEMMKEVTTDFNQQMSALIEKLVKENFEELNNSVKNMNDWQKENKGMIGALTNQFTEVSDNIKETSVSVNEITKNSKELTKENGSLSQLIQELQKVMINDTKFKEISDKLGATAETLKSNTDSFDKTSSKLNKWIQENYDFSDSVAKLLTRLEDIDRIKDINEVFWNNTKQQLSEGVGIIEKSNKKLAKDIESLDNMFHERLSDTLLNLDNLIQSIILKNNK